MKPIDLELGATLVGDNLIAAKEMLAILMASLPEVKQTIAQAYQQQDDKTLAKIVHKLHGGACYCGVPRLKAAAKTLEKILDTPQSPRDKLTPLYLDLINEINHLETAYAEQLA